MISQKPALKPLARIGSLAACGLLVVTLGACAGENTNSAGTASAEQSVASATSISSSTTADKLRADLHLAEDYRQSFVHGDKPAEYQKYIMLHDTEVNANAAAVINSWDNSGAGAAAHFIVDRDGSITQCVPLDKITHHAGFGDTGHGAQFGVEDDSRDDKVGTTSIGDKYADYGMNSYSIGIEMSHVGGKEEYPQAQLEAVDKVIAYIDAYYGFESQIIDHKMWRSTNSDTSAEFADYLANYQAIRRHTA